MNRRQQLGQEGEQQARLILKRMGFTVQSPDWLAYRDNKWICFEIKKKERFTPQPFYGHGLDESQVILREKLRRDTGIRTYLLIFEIPTDLIFGQYLDILLSANQDDIFLTSRNVRVFNLKLFDKLKL